MMKQVASVIDDKIQFNLIGGYVFDLSESLKFKPAFLVNYLSGAPVNLNLSANFLINDKFTIGASYRLESAISAMAGFQISNPVFFGVSYDYDTNQLGQYNNGTPEFVLKFYLGRTGRTKSGTNRTKPKANPNRSIPQDFSKLAVMRNRIPVLIFLLASMWCVGQNIISNGNKLFYGYAYGEAIKAYQERLQEGKMMTNDQFLNLADAYLKHRGL